MGFQKIKEKLPKTKRDYGALAISVVMAAPLIWFFFPDFGGANLPPVQAVEADVVLGSSSAPVRIIEYASLTCPHCAEYRKNVFPGIMGKYVSTGKVLYEYRNFPSNASGLKASSAVRCVLPERRMEAVTSLYDNQASWAFPGGSLVGGYEAILVPAYISQEDLSRCMSAGITEDEVLRQVVMGKTMGAFSTPAVFIDGKLFAEAKTSESIGKTLDREISAKASR